MRRFRSKHWSAELCFAYSGVFLIPVEQQSRAGLRPPFARALHDERDVSAAWVALFDRAMRSYFERISALAAAAPRYWRAPRHVNLCIVEDADAVRPYFTPFSKSSLTLYASDFDPECSNLEYAVYQLVHAERVSRTGDMGMAWIHDLSYFLVRSAEERQAFVDGCRTARRPDAGAFEALAERMSVLDSLHHDDLTPGVVFEGTATARIEPAGLTVAAEQQGEFQSVAKSFLAVANGVMQQHYERQRRGSHRSSDRKLVEWLVEFIPRVLLVDHLGGTLWDPEQPEAVEAIRAVLEGLPSGAAESLRDDWTLVDMHTRRFLDAMADPDELAPTGESLDQEDGVYLHPGRKIIAYCLAQPGFKTLAEEAPPYHRALVGARTIHEWGHLAADAGIVRVPVHREDEHRAAHEQVLDTFERIVASARGEHRATADREVELLRRDGYRLGDMPLQRAGDYQANLLACEFLSACEMEAYVRANVRTLVDEERIGPYLRLARYAYEYQYLALSRMEDPFDYLLSCTWFAEDLIDSGVVTEDDTRRLFDAVAQLFACYEIDTARIRLPR